MNSFIRNIGGSVGIALLFTFVTRQTQKHQNMLAVHASSYNPAFEQLRQGIVQSLTRAGISSPSATRQSYARISGMIQAQSVTLAYIDVISALALLVAAMVPFVMIMRRPKRTAAPQPMH